MLSRKQEGNIAGRGTGGWAAKKKVDREIGAVVGRRLGVSTAEVSMCSWRSDDRQSGKGAMNLARFPGEGCVSSGSRVEERAT